MALTVTVGLARASAPGGGEPLLLGPVEGFTTQWSVLPGSLAFPEDRAALLRQYAPPGACVIWSGAEEVRRDGRSSFARAEARDRRSSWITATVEPREGEPWTSRVRVDWIALRPEDLVVGAPCVKGWNRDEERRAPSVLLAEVRAAGEAGDVHVGPSDAVGFLAEVVPSAAAPLVEWRFDGRALPVPAPSFARSCRGSPSGAGVVLRVPEAAFLVRRLGEPGEMVVEVGPPGRAATRRVHVRDAAAQAPPSSPRKHLPSQSWIGPLFEEITTQAGIQHSGESFGASFGFVNDDPYPDIWCGNHREFPSLYLSVHGRSFVDVAAAAVPVVPGDAHGAALADFDRDGDQDVLELVGANFGQGSDANHFYASMGGVFLERAALLGLDYPEGRGRTPVWLDWDGDAVLDVLAVNFVRTDGTSPTALFRQGAGTFHDLAPQVYFGNTGHHRFAQLADLSDDGIPEVVVHGYPYPSNVFFLGDPAPVDQTQNLRLPVTDLVLDAAIADFNGDLHPDLFLARNSDDSGFRQVGTSRVELQLVVDGAEHGLGISAAGSLSMTLGPSYSVAKSDVFVGASGWHPPSLGFVLDAADPSVQGIPPHVGGVDDGVYVWRDPVAGTWELRQSWSSFNALNHEITTEHPVGAITALGFDPLKPPPVDRLLVRQGKRFVDVTAAAGLDVPVADGAVGAGDFDNDMDLDLYLVCFGPVSNLPNRYFENLGGAVFVEVPGGAGAAGSAEGRGESVAVADHDLDGFLDLFVTNGNGSEPFFDGPHQLFRNLGNQNHWIEVRLVGTTSNVEAIGARVVARAGGITQLREQGGGMHCWSQDLPVLHFGLGPNTTVDLVVRWPSGTVQNFPRLAADQVLTLVEP